MFFLTICNSFDVFRLCEMDVILVFRATYALDMRIAVVYLYSKNGHKLTKIVRKKFLYAQISNSLGGGPRKRKAVDLFYEERQKYVQLLPVFVEKNIDRFDIAYCK